MKRRCTFLDKMPAFNYNQCRGEHKKVDGKDIWTDTSKLGSTLMRTMLKEVSDFCDPHMKESWSQQPHQQLIYDFRDGGGSFGLISLLPDDLPAEEKSQFTTIGADVPSMAELYSRKTLDMYLSRALGVPLKNDRLAVIDKKNYVLTLDFTLKMLNIHERYECGIPAIIEGETGVGKTALVEMLSHLWKLSWLTRWERDKDRILDKIKKKIQGLAEDPGVVEGAEYTLCMEAMHKLGSGGEVSEDELEAICQLPHSGGKFCKDLNDLLVHLEGDTIFSVLELDLKDKGSRLSPGLQSSLSEDTCQPSRALLLSDAFKSTRESKSPKATAHLLRILFTAKLRGTFYKLNVHAALSPADIKKFFKPIFVQADELQNAYDACDSKTERPLSLRVPFVTVYLDEINTANCLGLFKEIITDKSIDGKPIPKNVFIIAACNPHRGNSLVAHGNNVKAHDDDLWLKGTYYVRKLHPTLEFLTWDYGSLNQQQEREYVNAKLEMLNRKREGTDVKDELDSADLASLADLIVNSQTEMRTYAEKQLKALRVPDAKLCAKSSVSQRDIQRVFNFYQWLMKVYTKLNPHNDTTRERRHRRAVLVSLAVVYFMRLSSKYREEYRSYLDRDRLSKDISFSKAYKDELEWYISKVELPPGIAKTTSLKENVFATIICAATHTPLIIVGEPGSSKTLSFNVVVANLKGKESRVEIFRKTDLYHSLDPHFYQCSRRTTSKEVERTFRVAVNRQRSLQKIPLPVYCVVFMDEAGLPEESRESLKVLHYYLDKQEVPFVGISNYILDAAKTNRAVSLFRPKATSDELFELAKGCVVTAGPVQASYEEMVGQFCESYTAILADHDGHFQRLFGLRDFVYFLNYIRHRLDGILRSKLILESLERNFNGTEAFKFLCEIFFRKIGVPLEGLPQRNVLEILKSSLSDRADFDTDDVHNNIQNEVRYKLIIDPSEDDSLVRLLFTHGVLQRDQTRVYIVSDFHKDNQLKVNTIAQIRHSVSAGHTILMCQTDEIHESFYDLFNQRFLTIKDRDGVRLYANIAIGAHSKPSRVHPKFQCVVVIKSSELHQTPPPFLNRFEKYYLSHRSLLDTVIEALPVCLRILLRTAFAKVSDFVARINARRSNLYGFSADPKTNHTVMHTLDSLMLTVLPCSGQEYKPYGQVEHPEQPETVTTDGDEGGTAEEIEVLLLQTLLSALVSNAGFRIPKYSAEELKADARHLFSIVCRDPEFTDIIHQLQPQELPLLVDEVLHILYYSPGPHDGEPVMEVHKDSCMVISLLLQWLISYMSRRLLQLMTPEALIVNSKHIPIPYRKMYLQFQDHFSVRELACRQLSSLERNSWDSSTTATKLLCFTRSSPLIHQLPSDFPTVIVTETNKETLQNLLFENLSHLMMCKVNRGHSQSQIQKLLKRFMSSDARVLVLIANMQDLTKKMVNHLRILIEEAENDHTCENTNKLFVVLLHFPPVMFYKSCYPSLFLQGWDHHYLDAIGHGTLTWGGIKSVIDIKDWFTQCCLKENATAASNDQMVQTLKDMLPEAIPIVASRVVLRKRCSIAKTFQPMNVSERIKVFELLFEKLGSVLATRFRSFWKRNVMIEEMERVTKFMYRNESTLNITDTIQTVFRSLFFDFLIYMLSTMNTSHDIEFLLEDHSQELQELFMDLVEVVPIPCLSRLKRLSATMQAKHNHPDPTYRPSFPFFVFVYERLEKAVDDSKETVHRKTNLLFDTTDQHSEPSVSVSASVRQDQLLNKQMNQEELYVEVVRGRLEDYIANVQRRSDCLQVTVRALNEDSTENRELWKSYFTDLAHQKLHLEGQVIPLTLKLLESYVGVPRGDDALNWLVALHVRLHVRQLNITKVTNILRPISRIHHEIEVEKTLTSPTSVDPVATLATLASVITPEDVTHPTLAAFVIETLLHSLQLLVATSTSSTDVESSGLVQWHHSYRDLISMPVLEEDIMGSVTSEHEMQCTAIHTIYLLITACTELGYQKHCFTVCQEVFTKLKGIRDRSGFGEVTKTVMAAMCRIPTSASSGAFVKCLVEGLFAYFFSEHRISYKEEDCREFLALANRQTGFTTVTDGDCEWNDYLCSCTSLNVFKLYLMTILGKAETGTMLGLHDPMRRKVVGEVIFASEPNGTPGPYIPVFYQLEGMQTCEASKNALMQQPLAHLYFNTVVECMTDKKFGAINLLRLAKDLTKGIDISESSVWDKVLLLIEKQAVIQLLLQQLATYFDPKDAQKLQGLFTSRMVKGVNSLLDDETTGGSTTSVSGHGLVLALHLQNQFNSTSKLIEMLRDGQSELVRNIHCVKPLQALIQDPSGDEIHLFPFIGTSVTDISTFYREIFEAMLEVHTTKASPQSVKAFVNLARESCADTSSKMQLTGSLSINRRMAFRMLVWLCAYYKFFCIKKHRSTVLANEIGTCLQHILEPEFIALLQSFIDPKSMICTLEAPPILDENDERLAVVDGHVVPVERKGELSDPIYELFNPPQKSKPDISDTQLCHAMANMVAVVLALEPRSNHLWYHLFAADSLKDTYVMGFMYDSKVKEGRLYDCGMELTTEGRYGRPDYIDFATHRPLSLHSLYLVLWTNYAALCMALISQADGQQKISHVLSPWQPIRHYCVTQLRSVWLHMGQNMNLTIEEQSFFIMKSMETLLKLGIQEPHSVQAGLFDEAADLRAYESTWHNRIFAPNASCIRSELAKHQLKPLKQLAQYYPFFPSVEEFSHSLMSTVSIGDQRSPWYILSQFALEYPRLKAGGALLPDLIQLYWWMHTELAYLVSREYAQNHSIEQVLTKVDEKYPGMEIFQLYERVRGAYNHYVEVIAHSIGAGACANVRRRGRIFHIEDDTKLLHFLSEEEEEGTTNDWLYIVIADIVNHHNSFLQRVFDAVNAPEHSALRLYFPENQTDLNDSTLKADTDTLAPDLIYPTEVNDRTCTIGAPTSTSADDGILALVRSRCNYPLTQASQKPPDHSYEFQLLQKDLIKAVLVGRPCLHSPAEHLRKAFKFHKPVAQGLALGVSLADVETLNQYLADDSGLKLPLDPTFVKKLECEFHTADYHTMLAVATGLRTATEHLVKAVCLPDAPASGNDLQEKTVPAFLRLVYNQEKSPEQVMHEIGISTKRVDKLSPHQLDHLLSLPLPYLYSTLKLFVRWIEEGMYDFCELPLDMKKDMQPKDEEAIRTLSTRFEGVASTVMEEIETFNGVLVHSESEMRKTIGSNKEKPITTFLKDYRFYDENEHMLRVIPDTILCQHYVALRVAIRKWMQCSGDISARDPVQPDQQKSAEWAEYASELWVDDTLGHIRKAAIPYDYGTDFVYDPTKGMFGFQEGMEEQEEDEDQELSFIDAQPNEPEIQATAAVGEPPQPQPEPQELLQPRTEVGELWAHDFEKQYKIGGGTGGVVFRGVWTTKELPVAMKKLFHVDDVQGLDICREVTILSKLRHSNIIWYYGTVTLVDGYYIVTELAEKGSLWHFLQNHPDPDLQQSFRWAKEIARGVEYLHQYKCIHRDLKSGNVLLMEDLTAKICDFGSAKHVQMDYASTVRTSPTGTHQWRSPEAIRGKKASSSWDVYSYGLLLWELVTHKIPFSHLNLRIPGQEFQLQAKISNGERPPIPDSCNPKLVSLMQRCWTEEPKSRPTFTEICTALEGIVITKQPQVCDVVTLRGNAVGPPGKELIYPAEGPSIQEFQCLRWNHDGRQECIKIMSKLTPRWRGFGIALGFTMEELDTIDLQCLRDPQACIQKLFGQWARTKKTYSWSGMVMALKDSDHDILAAEVEQFLSSITVSFQHM